jgi:hypothetical protein
MDVAGFLRNGTTIVKVGEYLGLPLPAVAQHCGWLYVEKQSAQQAR